MKIKKNNRKKIKIYKDSSKLNLSDFRKKRQKKVKNSKQQNQKTDFEIFNEMFEEFINY
jgi:hypothetical protein